MITVGSLFAGIGGLELGLSWALAEAGIAHRLAWQVERDPFCRLVLAKHWPEADRSVVDVCQAGSSNLAPVDIICGGFPCQDVSSAGKGAGLEGERSGLWYEFRRIVGELRPRAVVVENVASGAARWLPFVVADLEALGYAVEPHHISAADVGAPHRRARVFVVADANPRGLARVGGSGELDAGERAQLGHDLDRRGDPAGPQVDGRPAPESGMDRSADGLPDRLDRGPHGPSRSLWPAGPGEQQHTWEPPRAVWRGSVIDHEARLAALGNGVVPQCSREAGRTLCMRLEAA